MRAVSLACLVAGGALTLDMSCAAAGARVTPLGAIDVAGSIMHVALDHTGSRLLLATVRYPAIGVRRDEAHLHELKSRAPGRLSTVAEPGLVLEIDRAEAVALSPDGARLAVGCGDGVCIRSWAGPEDKQLAASGRRREIGALAFRPDVGLIVAGQRARMEILSWEPDRGTRHQWALASAAERLRELFTPRLHGRPSWAPGWVGISPDGQRVGAIRDDGTVSLWSRTGQPIKSLTLPPSAEMNPAFAPDGTLVALRAADGRLSAIDVESERVLLAVDERSSRSMQRAALLFGARGGYLAVSLPEGVVLHVFASGEVATVVPVPDQVWRMALSGDGRVVAVATQHRVTLWSLVPGS